MSSNSKQQKELSTKQARELDKKYLGGHLGATKTKELFKKDSSLEKKLSWITSTFGDDGKDFLKKLANQGLNTKQINSVLGDVYSHLHTGTDFLRNLDISKVKFSSKGEASNLDDLMDTAAKATKAEKDLAKEIASARERATNNVDKESFDAWHLTEELKNSKLSRSQKAFVFSGIGDIFGLDEKAYKKLVTDIAQGKDNNDYTKAIDLLKVNNEKDVKAFLKKYNIKDDPENRKKLSTQWKQMRKLKSASDKYEKMIKSGQKMFLWAHDRNFEQEPEHELVKRAMAYENDMETAAYEKAKKVAAEKAEDELITKKRYDFADTHGDDDKDIKILNDPTHPEYKKTVEKYKDKKGFADYNAAVKKRLEKNKKVELKAKQEKNNNAMAQKSSGETSETKDQANKNPSEISSETKAQKAKETQTAAEESSSHYETFTRPMKPKNATGQASESSSDSKSSSSSAQDINVSINLVLDDKVIQAITQKVTAGQNKN